MRPRVGGGWQASGGFTGVDVVLALLLATTMAALAAPLATHALDVAAARHAATYLAATLRSVRLRAIASRETTAVVFDQVAGVWGFRVCRDGNANGVRRAEIRAGIDVCEPDRVEVAARFRGIWIGVDGALPGPEGDPASPDPVRFGAADMASCTPTGGCTPGSVFVRSTAGTQFATRIGGMTGRARVLRYEPGGRRWVPE
jgi:type II secretory pathway pseudopilin PulG